MKKYYVIIDKNGQYWSGFGFVLERRYAAKWTSLESISQVLSQASRLTGCSLQAWRVLGKKRG